MDPLYLDYETFSDINLKNQGSDVYCRSSNAEVLMAGYAIGDGPVLVWDLSVSSPMPLALVPYLIRNEGQIIAFNAPFEIDVTQHILGYTIKIDQWRCAQVAAYGMSFAGGLDQILAAVFDGKIQKDVEGKKLINRFCKPAPPNHKADRYTRDTHPEEWAAFVKYCRTDITTLRSLWKWLQQYSPMSDQEWQLWALDRIINQRGIPVDTKLVDIALSAMAETKSENEAKLHQVTGLQKATPIPLKAWFNANGLAIENLQKETKTNALKTLQPGAVKHALELSLQIAQASSSSKWNAFNRRTDKGTQVLRGSLQFAGAGRTRRWAGRGIQLQNLKRTTPQTDINTQLLLLGFPVSMDQISTSIRSAIKAPEGKTLVVSDLSSIESRLAGWLTNCKVINETFKQGKDTYRVLASSLYAVQYDNVAKAQRSFAKPAALGAQYMLGGKGLVRYAEGMGVTLEEAEAKQHIEIYRQLYPELVQFWAWIKSTVAQCLSSPTTQISGYNLTVYMQGDFLFILLPSGRRLNYYQPEMIREGAPWDKDQIIDKFSFMGVDSLTTQWKRITAHAGGLLENIIQAIARDVLAVWMTRVDLAGVDIRGHVHDELITVANESEGENTLKCLNYLAAYPIEWAPGLLLTADGYISERYRKD